MAYDRDTQLKIRAYYESHDESLAKVAVHFQSMGYEVKQKTIEHWASNKEQEMGKWVKNRYDSLKAAVEQLLPEAVLLAGGESVREAIVNAVTEESSGVVSTEVIDSMTNQVSKTLVFDVLGKHNIQREIATTLQRAGMIAAGSTSMAVLTAYHAMLISASQHTHGKKVVFTIQDPNNKILDDKALDAKTTEELLEMME